MLFYLCFCVTSLVKTVEPCIGHKNCIMKIGTLLIMRLKVLIQKDEWHLRCVKHFLQRCQSFNQNVNLM